LPENWFLSKFNKSRLERHRKLTENETFEVNGFGCGTEAVFDGEEAG
jgi:hypothetical protein